MINRIFKQSNHIALLGTFAAISSAALTQLISHLIIARELGVSGAGIYFVALALHRVVEAVFCLGFPTALAREMAILKSKNAWASARSLALKTAKWSVASGCVGMALIFTISATDFNITILKTVPTQALLLVSLAGPPACCALAFSAALRGLGRPIYATLAGPFVASIICLLAFVIGLDTLGSFGAIISFALGQYVGCIGLAVAAFSVLPKVNAPHSAPTPKLRSRLPFWIVGLTSMGNDSIGALLLGHFAGPHEAGLFGVAARVALPLMLLGMAMQNIYEPQFASRAHPDTSTRLKVEYREAIFASTAGGTFLCVTLWLVADEILALFGREFIGATPIMMVLLFGSALSTATTPAASLLAMTGHAEFNARLMITSLFMTSFLTYFLAQNFGGLGAATAVCLGNSIRAIIQLVAAESFVRRLA